MFFLPPSFIRFRIFCDRKQRNKNQWPYWRLLISGQLKDAFFASFIFTCCVFPKPKLYVVLFLVIIALNYTQKTRDVDPTLNQRLQRWPNLKPTLDHSICVLRWRSEGTCCHPRTGSFLINPAVILVNKTEIERLPFRDKPEDELRWSNMLVYVWSQRVRYLVKLRFLMEISSETENRLFLNWSTTWRVV